MIPTGLVNATVLKAGAAFVNPGSLGQAIGSGSSQGIATTIDEQTGLEVELSLRSTIEQINAVTSQSWYQRLTEFLQNFEAGTTDQDIIDSWNNVVDDDGVFFDILGIYNRTTRDIVGPSLTASSFNTTLQLLPSWFAETVVGSASTSTNNINSVTGNVERFSPAIAISESYVSQNNQFTDSVTALNNAETTFTNMNNWVTSGVTGVTLATRAFGEDLEKTGRLIDLAQLSQLGSPGQLIARMSQTNALSVLLEKLSENNIDVRTVVERGGDAPPILLKAVYNALTNIGGSELDTVKKVLQIRTENIETVADLLDPRKIFPNSYSTFTSPVFGTTVEFKPIYSDDSGGISQEFSRLGGRLRSVMPPEIAAANAALSRSISQITSIFSVPVDDFARVLQEVETLKENDFIQNQSELVEDSVEDIWRDASSPIELGTGPQGRLLLTDLIGLVSGYNIVAPIQQNKDLFLELESAGAFTPFTRKGDSDDPNIGFFQVIEYLLSGEYTFVNETGGPDSIIISYIITIPSGVKGEGVYEEPTLGETISKAWFEGIYPELVAATKTIVSDNPETASTIINNTTRWQIHRAREFTNRSRLLEPNFRDLPHAREDSLRFAQQLPQRAQQTVVGGAGQILEGIADRSNQGGQAMIAALREGRNIERLEAVGISTRSIRPIPEGDQISIAASQYSVEEAKTRLS